MAAGTVVVVVEVVVVEVVVVEVVVVVVVVGFVVVVVVVVVVGVPRPRRRGRRRRLHRGRRLHGRRRRLHRGRATVVANCRKGNPSAAATANQYGDIAVIQYNKQNGAVCFYQAYGVANGNAMPAPSTGSGPWISPAATHAGGCTGCHDNGAFIKSRYLTQLDSPTFPSKPNLIPSEDEGYMNDDLPLSYVGRDYVADRSWSIDTAKIQTDNSDPRNCNYCHRLAVNNVNDQTGTAAHLGPMATANTFLVGGAGKDRKTPHGPTSPIWMRPDQVTYNAGAEATAQHFRDCAYGYWGSNSTPGWTTGTPTAGCTFDPLGVPFEPFADSQGFTDVNIGITGGTRTPNDMVQTLQAAGTDIFGSADQFLYSYKLLAGDGAATVKVSSLTPTNAFARRASCSAMAPGRARSTPWSTSRPRALSSSIGAPLRAPRRLCPHWLAMSHPAG